ncbi:polysaccharide biosynthesis/export family protein [Cognatishimia sp. WU-CL00825]|uniref:polysaccharide biosynthesis/export family protein n=1 Tax=Cognatishimia sp. WU-CL00825 TaxID=3127658 RepID=UPI003105B6CB
MRLTSTLLGLSLICATPLAADPYRLVVGDQITLNYNFLQTPKTATIDLDGNIRLSEIGSIVADGKTFDEVEADVTDAMVKGGFSGIPFVSVEISEYAPIIVSGFIERGGRFDFAPGMTVGVALALSGGAATLDAPTGGNSELSSLAARRRSTTLATDIADTAARISRLEAALAGPEAPVVLPEDLQAAVPRSELPGLENRLIAEAKVLDRARLTAAILIKSWDKEIAEGQLQIGILDERLGLKESTIARISEDLDAARSLQSQGLATNTRTSGLVQRLADEREDLLAIETAKINVRRAISLAERNRQRYESDQHQTRLEALRDARNLLNTLQQNYRISLSELALLYGDVNGLALDDGGIGLQFSILGPRAARFANETVTSNTVLLPGDIVVVGTDVQTSAN